MNSPNSKIFATAVILLLWIVAGIYIINRSMVKSQQNTDKRIKLENSFPSDENSKALLFHFDDSKKNTLY